MCEFRPLDHALLVERPYAAVCESSVGGLQYGSCERAGAVDGIGRRRPVVRIGQLIAGAVKPLGGSGSPERAWVADRLELAPQDDVRRDFSREHVGRYAGEVEAEDVDFKPARLGLSGPVLHDVKIAVVDVEVPSVEIEDGPAIHDVTPLEWLKNATRPSARLKGRDIDVAAVVHGKVPVAVCPMIAACSRPTEPDRDRVRYASAHGHNLGDEVIVMHHPIIAPPRIVIG